MSARAPTQEELHVLGSSKSFADLDRGLYYLHGSALPGTVVLYEVPEDHLIATGTSSIVVGSHRSVFFTKKADLEMLVSRVVRDYVLGEDSMRKVATSVEAPRTHKGEGLSAEDRAALLRKVSPAKGYDLLFSLLVPQPEAVMATWDMEEAVESFIDPFLDSLGNFSDFDVKSQV